MGIVILIIIGVFILSWIEVYISEHDNYNFKVDFKHAYNANINYKELDVDSFFAYMKIKDKEVKRSYLNSFKFTINDLPSPMDYYSDCTMDSQFVSVILSAAKPIRKTYINENGYVCFVNSHKGVHRWVMEKSLGRKLTDIEVVHHIDGDKLNNRIENLRLFPNQAEHNQHHLNNQIEFGSWYERVPEHAIYRNYHKFRRLSEQF